MTTHFPASGSVKRNVAPRSALFSAQMRPPCASTIVREIDSPTPMPFGLVVKNGSNRRPSFSARSRARSHSLATSTHPLPVSARAHRHLRSRSATSSDRIHTR